MDTRTGELLTKEDFEARLTNPAFDPTHWVQIEGYPEDVEVLAQKVRMASADIERRKARRKAQKASRRANRG